MVSLSTRFQTEVERLQSLQEKRDTQRIQRDDFIALNFPLLDAQFSTMLSDASGAHVKFTLNKNTIVDTFTNRGFLSLEKTVIEVQSTLYGKLEKLKFIPELESIYAGQFGVIRVEAEGLIPTCNGEHGQLLKSMLVSGILMRGQQSVRLVLKNGANYIELNNDLLEELLADVFIRST